MITNIIPFPAFVQHHHPLIRRVLLSLVLAVLVIGLVLSVREERVALANLDWWYLCLVMVLPIPLVLFFTVLEYVLMGRLLGKKLGFGHSVEVTIIGVATNMLPLPGSTLVRLAGLKAAGARWGDGAFASFLVFLLWLAVAAIYSGIAIVALEPLWLGGVLVAAGALLMVGSFIAARRYSGSGGIVAMVAAIRFAVVVLEAVRLYFCFRALGMPATYLQASGLTITTVLGSVVSIVPAGLGIREAVAAAFSPILDIAMTEGFLATVLNRLLAMVVVIPLAVVLVIRSPDRLGQLVPRR